MLLSIGTRQTKDFQLKIYIANCELPNGVAMLKE